MILLSRQNVRPSKPCHACWLTLAPRAQRAAGHMWYIFVEGINEQWFFK